MIGMWASSQRLTIVRTLKLGATTSRKRITTRQDGGVRIAAQDLDDLPADPRRAVRGIHQHQAAGADGQRQGQRQDEHREADPALVDEVGRGNERDQPRTEVGDRDANQEHEPQQRTRRHPGEKQLLALRHAAEQHQRRPAEHHLHQASELTTDERDQRRQDSHGSPFGNPCATVARP